VLQLELARFDGALELPLQGVGGAADPLPFLRGKARESLQDFGEGPGLAAEELSLELLKPPFVRVRDVVQTLPQRL
jgi:hypothetical protein